jgi:hypothetical protein
MGARNRGGIGLSYRPARLHRLAEFIPWNQFRGPINISKYGLRGTIYTVCNGGDGLCGEHYRSYALYLTRFRTFKIAF